MSATETTNTKTVREFTRIRKNEHNADGIDHLFDPAFQVTEIDLIASTGTTRQLVSLIP